jgi:hypothetical protein
MAQYDHGVKFDYPKDSDGFISHVARRGAEKTTTGGVWLLGSLFLAATYELIRNLLHSFGIWLLIVPVGAVVIFMVFVLVAALTKSWKTTGGAWEQMPWVLTYTCADGRKVDQRFASKESALKAAANRASIWISGKQEPLLGYEAWWAAPREAASSDEDTESSGFRPVAHAGVSIPPPGVPASARCEEVDASVKVASTTPEADDDTDEGAPGTDDVAPLGMAAELERLAKLHHEGILSDAEFAAAKRKMLGG